jgi:hypothetical protein
MAFPLVFTNLPKPPQPVGLAIFDLSVTFAPAIGPTIGLDHCGCSRRCSRRSSALVQSAAMTARGRGERQVGDTGTPDGIDANSDRV